MQATLVDVLGTKPKGYGGLTATVTSRSWGSKRLCLIDSCPASDVQFQPTQALQIAGQQRAGFLLAFGLNAANCQQATLSNQELHAE